MGARRNFPYPPSPAGTGKNVLIPPRITSYNVCYTKLLRHTGVCHGIFVDNPVLRRGVLWGVWRLALSRPDLAEAAAPDLLAVLDPARVV